MKKTHEYRGLKVAITVKILAHSELQIRNEKLYRAQIRAGIKSLNANSNFFIPKQVKLGTLLILPETKLKTKSLFTARVHKEN